MNEITFSPPEVDSLVELFSVETDSAQEIRSDGLSDDTHIFKVDWPGKSRVFLIDSQAGKDIACHPSIVGEKLENLALAAASEAVPLITERAGGLNDGRTLFLNVLRAAPGYKLHEAFEERGMVFKQSWIRPRYVRPSYRDHEGEEKRIQIIHESFEDFPSGKRLRIIKPDTEATGKTSEVALRRTFDIAKEKKSEIDHIIIYGFVSKPGLQHIETFLRPYGTRISVFAIENLTVLCSNRYDMPMYGVDESFFSEHHGIMKLGGIVSRKTFERLLPEFIMGADEPGDWSARQTRVFDGVGFEEGGIAKHVSNSIALIERLREVIDEVPEIATFRERYNWMIEREFARLRALTCES